MAKKKEIVLHKDGFRFVFSMEGKGKNAEVLCKGYKVTKGQPATIPKQELVLDWAFPDCFVSRLQANAAILLDQALMYAKNPPN